MAQFDKSKLLENLTQAVLKNKTLDAFVRAAHLELAKAIPGVDDFGITRFHADQQMWEVVESAQDDGATNRGVRYKNAPATPGGFLLKMGRTVMINDFDAFAAQMGSDMRRLFPRPFESGIGALLQRGDKVLGYLYLTSARKNGITEEHRDLIDSVRPVVSLAFEAALAYSELERLREEADNERQYLRSEIQSSWPADGLIGKSPEWKVVIGQLAQVAPTESTVLIQGETGTGKEVIARAIHERSRRAGRPLIKLNCGALPENLIESELFGHEKGSFTGALGRRIGRFELAHGGTIFLDEIGEMPLTLQVRLLRVLQEREFERVGGEKPIRVDVRVIAATNRDLSREVAAGRFRADLYYRLNVFPISVPPLRMRPDDAEELARYFLEKTASRMGRPGLKFAPGSIEGVRSYSWPGNVRELEHLVERGIILADRNIVDISSLLVPQPTLIAFPEPPPPTPVEQLREGKAVVLKEKLVDDEKAAIEAALVEAGGVIGGVAGAAARLGMKRQTLQSKIKKHGIVPEELLASAT